MNLAGLVGILNLQTRKTHKKSKELKIAVYDAGGVGGTGPNSLDKVFAETKTHLRRVGAVDILDNTLSQFDLVIFDPLGSFLSFYAYAVLAGWMDTYDFYGGNHAYDQAREIALRGMASDYPKGWSTRVQLLKEVTGNKGLREARFAYYVAMDLFDQGKPDDALREFGLMMEGFETVFGQFPTGRTLYFLNANRKKLIHRLNVLGQNDILSRLSERVPAHKEKYLRGLRNN